MDRVIEECPDDTYPVEMKEGGNDTVDDENKKMMRKKRKTKQQILKAPHLVKVKDLMIKEVATMLI